MDPETRQYFKTLRGEITSMRSDVTSLRDDITTMRGDFSSIQGEMAAVRSEMTAGFAAVDLRFEMTDTKIDRTAADTRRHFEVTVEGIRHQMQILAEGVVMNAQALSRFRAEFIAEIHELRRGR